MSGTIIIQRIVPSYGAPRWVTLLKDCEHSEVDTVEELVSAGYGVLAELYVSHGYHIRRYRAVCFMDDDQTQQPIIFPNGPEFETAVEAERENERERALQAIADLRGSPL